MQNLIEFHQFIIKSLSGNEILTSIKGQNYVRNSQKLTSNDPNLDLVNINAYAKFGQIPSICSQDIEQKQSRNDGQPENSIPPPILSMLSVYLSYDLCLHEISERRIFQKKNPYWLFGADSKFCHIG